MAFLGLDHICIDVSDMKAAKDFYISKLGFVETAPANIQGKIQTAFLRAGGVIVDVKCPVDGKVQLRAQEQGFQTGINHIALKVDDIQKTYKELSAKGVSFKGEPKFMAHSNRWIAIFHDPDGNCFHLTT